MYKKCRRCRSLSWLHDTDGPHEWPELCMRCIYFLEVGDGVPVESINSRGDDYGRFRRPDLHEVIDEGMGLIFYLAIPHQK